MILDELLEFCDATAIHIDAADMKLVGDVIDLAASTVAPTTRDIGTGEPLYLVIQVDTAITSAGACTVKFGLYSDAQAAIAVDGSATVHLETAAIAKASLTAGTVVYAGPIPAGTYERYLGICATVGTTKADTGKINAFLTHDISKWKALPDAIAGTGL